MIGATLFATIRAVSGPPAIERPEPEEPLGGTRAALQEMMRLSPVDPAREEALFAQGLRRLVVALTP